MRKTERTRQWSAGVWLKSSRSDSVGACVEVRAIEGGVAVRDSKYPEGPQLAFTELEWAAFLAGARDGEFDGLI
jgi:hypothetical protein